ncbi:hypothetical protein [Streptomyces sp. NBC_01092]|uniref:hypothetical protein n=1 Tax=Streptomyces sp. NBC_01092 TaxID=2903748 RepID=UPI0038674149|nr:hypothetical protein OG254_38620 [Streptomyces sp. NBC_01092]
MTGDRNGLYLIGDWQVMRGGGLGTAQDRNPGLMGEERKAGERRSSSGATKNRNAEMDAYKPEAKLVAASHRGGGGSQRLTRPAAPPAPVVAVVLRGVRGSQRDGQADDVAGAGEWRSGTTEDRSLFRLGEGDRQRQRWRSPSEATEDCNGEIGESMDRSMYGGGRPSEWPRIATAG